MKLNFWLIIFGSSMKLNFKAIFQAPPRADVVKSLKNGIVLNLLGMGAAILGMQATVGLLVAKALTTSAVPYYRMSPRQSPVLALDVFLVQVIMHFPYSLLRSSYLSLRTCAAYKSSWQINKNTVT